MNDLSVMFDIISLSVRVVALAQSVTDLISVRSLSVELCFAQYKYPRHFLVTSFIQSTADQRVQKKN